LIGTSLPWLPCLTQVMITRTLKVLQNWLSDVIGHLEALPEPTQIALGLALFKIGDEHFHWRADQIKSWHKERCRSLRQQLSELQREQWQSPVGALPSRFCAPSVAAPLG
jgi:hypothetical protein